MNNKDNIINFDFQGWPVEKTNMREIINNIFHPETIEVNGKKYIAIPEDSEILNQFPLILEDDGMGYGVHEQYITETRTNEDGSIVMFRDSKDEFLDIYLKNDVQPYSILTIDGEDWEIQYILEVNGVICFRLYKWITDDETGEVTYIMKNLPVKDFKPEYKNAF